MWIAAAWALISVTVARVSLFASPQRALCNRIFLTWILLIPLSTIVAPGPIPLALSAATLVLLKPADSVHKIAYFLGVLPALPDFYFYQIPFPGLQNLIEMSYFKVAVVVILLPIFFSYANSKAKDRLSSWNLIDKFVVIFSLYVSFMTLRDATLTSMLRAVVDQFITVVIPYFAISRTLSNKKAFHTALWGFYFMAAITAWIAIFETVVQWEFYRINTAERYSMRSGLLRISTTMNSSSLCTAVIGGFVIAEYFRPKTKSANLQVWVFRFLFVAAFFLTGNRGGIVQFAVAMFSLYSLKNLSIGTRRVMLVCGLIGTLTVVVAWNTVDWSLIDETGTFEYRVNLIDASMPQFLDYPLFGQTNYEDSRHFDHLWQKSYAHSGGKYLDITNWYLQVLLQFGLIGFVLFVAPFFMSASSLYQKISTFRSSDEQKLLYVCTFCLLVPFLIVIVTVSNVSLMPVFAIIFLSFARALTRF